MPLRWIAAMDYVKNLLQATIDRIVRYLRISLRLTARGIYQAISALWRASRIGTLLQFVLFRILRVLKWCGTALAILVGILIIRRLAYLFLPKLWKIYTKSRRRKLEEERWNNERNRQTEFLAELRAKQAAKATASKEAKIRQAREEQAIKDNLYREGQGRQAKGKADYMMWERECDVAFGDRASMTKFPFPSLPRCTDPNCFAFAKTLAPACQHNVRQFLKGSGRPLTQDFLKHQCKLWHEDRFASCREDLRPEFKRLANSLFVVLFPWYRELEQRQQSVTD
jgi:hypothetical protein